MTATTPAPGRTLASALAATTVGVLPAYVVGGLAVQLREDIGFGPSRLGLAVAIFFAASALGSAPFGRLAERLGAQRSTVIGVATCGVALLGIALVAGSWAALAGLLALAGAGNALVQVAVNLRLARRIPPGRRGLAFGMKLSAIPASTLLAGAAVPLLALTVGWRWAMATAALLAAVVIVVLLRESADPAVPRNGDGPLRAGDAAVGPLVFVAVAGGLGTAAANCLGAFLVDSAVVSGVAPGDAGWLLVLGSVVGIVTRLAVGHLADRTGWPALGMVAIMLAVGAVGLALLGEAGASWVLVLAVVLCFGAGWGWNGLYNLAVVRHNANAPAAASGITQSGVYAGGVVGPLVFGAVAEGASYGLAWRLAAGAAVISAGLHVLGGRRLRDGGSRA